ncbi:MAG TPA: hypothetical protein VKF80_09045 [Candidatus Eisenbacteria bacterium]|nr:hypothetical protein [Candidatus Eisenbacteria bacterium]
MRSRPLALMCAALLAGSPCWAAPSRAAKPKPKPAPTAAVTTKTATTTAAASTDSARVLHGGQEGTAFRSLTVEGEDKIQIEFERPPLNLDLDPTTAPGLDGGSARDVLDRTVPDLTTPLLTLSAEQRSPYLARPWLDRFQSGPVATFHPDLKEVERWTLLIADSRGKTVASFGGKGTPPKDLVWDGHAKDGSTVVPGLTYSYVLEAFDRAGNKRNFVGEGFQVSTYRVDTPQGPVLAFSGHDLVASETGGWNADTPSRATPPPMLVLEAASWLNQSPNVKQPVRVTATARSFEQANALSGGVAKALAPLLLGDPARVQAVTDVQPDAPAEGAVTIAPGH